MGKLLSTHNGEIAFKYRKSSVHSLSYGRQNEKKKFLQILRRLPLEVNLIES